MEGEREGVSAMAHETLAPWADRVPDRGRMTADELLAMGDSGKGCELVEGTLVRVAPTGILHGMSVSRLNAAVTLHAAREGSGVVVGAETGFVLSRPGAPDTVLAPDVAYVRSERIAGLARADLQKFLRLAPDLVAEIAPPDQYRPEMTAKASVYLEAGVRLVWIVWPAARTVDVWRPGGTAPVTTLAVGDALGGLDVLPGFSYPLKELFA